MFNHIDQWGGVEGLGVNFLRAAPPQRRAVQKTPADRLPFNRWDADGRDPGARAKLSRGRSTPGQIGVTRQFPRRRDTPVVRFWGCLP